MNLLKKSGTDFLRQNETSEKDWKIGFEVERFAVDKKTGVQLPYCGPKKTVKKIIETLVSKYKFEPVFHERSLMGAKNHFADISIEPGSQFEIAFNPQNDFAKLINHFIEINDILNEISVSQDFIWLSVGHNPHSHPKNIQLIPKKRYHIMEKYLSSTGSMALHMMKCTASIQTSVDFKSESHFKSIMKLCHLMAPVMSGWFANSPFKVHEKDYANFRNYIWRNVDKTRCGHIPQASEGNLGYSQYMDYLSKIPLMLAYNDNLELSHIENMKNSDYFSKSSISSETNLDLLLSSVFTLSRSKNYIEYRVFDALPLELTMLPPFLSSLIFYSEKSICELESFFQKFNEKDMLQGFEQAALYGINGIYKQKKIHEIAGYILSICRKNISDVKGVEINPKIAEKLFLKAESLISDKKSPSEASILKESRTHFPGILIAENIISDSAPLKELLS